MHHIDIEDKAAEDCRFKARNKIATQNFKDHVKTKRNNDLINRHNETELKRNYAIANDNLNLR